MLRVRHGEIPHARQSYSCPSHHYLLRFAIAALLSHVSHASTIEHEAHLTKYVASRLRARALNWYRTPGAAALDGCPLCTKDTCRFYRLS